MKLGAAITMNEGLLRLAPHAACSLLEGLVLCSRGEISPGPSTSHPALGNAVWRDWGACGEAELLLGGLTLAASIFPVTSDGLLANPAALLGFSSGSLIRSAYPLGRQRMARFAAGAILLFEEEPLPYEPALSAPLPLECLAAYEDTLEPIIEKRYAKYWVIGASGTGRAWRLSHASLGALRKLVERGARA